MFEMKPFDQRTPDSQYQDTLKLILQKGVRQSTTTQNKGCTKMLCPPHMEFDLRNGVPLITDRKIGFWRKALAEIFAMINGARTIEDFKRFGCDWWSQWGTKEACDTVGLTEGDLGPGTYGVGFHNFPTPGLTEGFNQFEALVRGLREKPFLRTHEVTPWVPYYASEYGNRKVFVAPCHGWIHCDVTAGTLNLVMRQRSADFPVGVPANMVQYSALLLALAQVTGLEPGRFFHTFVDAHIYEEQLPYVEMLLEREPRRFPTMRIVDTSITDLFTFRPEHFELTDYDPHPAIPGIPVAF